MSVTTPEVRQIPENAQKQLLNVYTDMQRAWEEFADLRKQFVDMIAFTRKAVGIPDHELWDLADDASHFTKLDLSKGEFDLEEAELEEVTMDAPVEVEDQRDHCVDPHDVTGA